MRTEHEADRRRRRARGRPVRRRRARCRSLGPSGHRRLADLPTAGLPAAVSGRAYGRLDRGSDHAACRARLDATPAGPRVVGDARARLRAAGADQRRPRLLPAGRRRARSGRSRSTPTDNFLAYAGLSALASARHDFATREGSTPRRGLAINPYSALLYGALSDAEIQLGNYDAAFDAVQTMVDLSPDTSSLSRASYTWELRGDARAGRAADAARPRRRADAADRAFTQFQLGELDFNAGDPNAALEHYLAALAASPDDPAALAGKATRARRARPDRDGARHLRRARRAGARADVPPRVRRAARVARPHGRGRGAVRDLHSSRSSCSPRTASSPTRCWRCSTPTTATPRQRSPPPRRRWRTTRSSRSTTRTPGRCTATGATTRRSSRSTVRCRSGYRSARFHFHAGMISLALGDDGRGTDRAHRPRSRSTRTSTRSRQRSPARPSPTLGAAS